MPSDRDSWPEGIAFYGGPFSNFVGTDIPVVFGPEDLAFEVAAGLTEPDGTFPMNAPTVEHGFQACKATAFGEFMQVLSAGAPAAAKALGQRVTLREDWEHVRYGVMLTLVRAKFVSSRYFRNALLTTGEEPIYEASPTDAVWGLWSPTERDWTGQNLLGKALMRVRAELRMWGYA